VAYTVEHEISYTDFPNVVLTGADNAKAVATLIAAADAKAAELKLRGTDGLVVLTLPDEPIRCESTVSVAPKNVGIKGAGTYAQQVWPGVDLTNEQLVAMNTARDTKYRNRPHWRFNRGTERCKMFPGFTIRGPHTTETPTYLRYPFEGQAGVWCSSVGAGLDLRNTWALDLCGVNVSDVWSDACYITADKAYGDNSQGIRWFGGTWGRLGRIGCVFAGASNVEIMQVTLDRGYKRDCFHIESGAVRAPGVSVQRNLAVRSCTIEGGNYFLHATGGAELDGFYATGNLRTNQPISFYLDGAPRHTDGTARYRNVYIFDNVHNRPQSGGYFLKFTRVDGINYARNQGPLRKTWPVADQIVLSDCKNAVIDPTGLYRAP
jgi:hypothetical protein